MKRIAVDVEDTLADIATLFIEKLNEKKGTNYRLEDWKSWELSTIGTSLEEYTSITRELWKRPESIPPTEPELDKKLKRIVERGYKIDIITARQDSEKEMKKWLKYHNIPYSRFKKN